jgi:hypothetical protein
LYNFFSSSPLRNQWRIIYEFMEKKSLLDSCFPKCFPSIKNEKHSILCYELKQLYVAITRTKHRLLIFESAEGFLNPMFDYWKKLCLVQVKNLDNSLLQKMQMKSSPAEWKSRGEKVGYSFFLSHAHLLLSFHFFSSRSFPSYTFRFRKPRIPCPYIGQCSSFSIFSRTTFCLLCHVFFIFLSVVV